MLDVVQKLKWVSLKMPSLYVVQYELYWDCVLTFWDLRWTRVKFFKEWIKLCWNNLDTCVPANNWFNRPRVSILSLRINVYHFPDTKMQSHNLLCIFLYKLFLILIRRTRLWNICTYTSLCSIYLKVRVLFFNFHLSAPQFVV